ncbi:MAG TPA: RlmE family RNA methyltransferase [Methanoregulaceae archaeon]|nr:MAG: RlmE family RNA methyltransferase [Methanolinea sp.]HON80871.1 RlmE family RNA methyltransferase [Methanoregulaceae archaeon]HPD09607.1 RlmE family RNA methyltransferase [Methanoregulaceae archaeon]HRT15277.1 RlmE family RNA methyltransferase [Methanoregulaceae archaeon]HRU30848.1 RlmE family RNA methyltransferase [Methanoregulaceae archaeon]
MGSQWGRDSAYVRAMQEGYRSRAAYKLIEIQNRYHLIREHDNVVDLGAAPGSWLQVIRAVTRGTVLGIDLSPIAPLDGVKTMVADFTDPALPGQVRSLVGTVNVVVSDAAPRLSGHKSYDQARAMALGEDALAFTRSVLKPGGNFLVKAFQGEDFSHLLGDIRYHFLSARTFRSRATRKGSSEIYIIAKNFVGTHEAERPL